MGCLKEIKKTASANLQLMIFRAQGKFIPFPHSKNIYIMPAVIFDTNKHFKSQNQTFVLNTYLTLI